MRTILAFVLLWGAVVAAFAYEPPPTLPAVKQVWLPEVPVLGPVRLAYQDPGHVLQGQDEHAYCFNPESSGSQARQREQDPHGHRCACHLVCQIGAAGEISGDHESNDCATWCVRDICRCHVESPCEMPQ